MASDYGQSGSSRNGESSMLRFFLPGLVVGVVIGSMLGLYVGTRSGSASLSDIKPAIDSTPRTDDRTREPDPPATTTPATTDPAPAPDSEKQPSEPKP